MVEERESEREKVRVREREIKETLSLQSQRPSRNVLSSYFQNKFSSLIFFFLFYSAFRRFPIKTRGRTIETY